MDQLEAALDCGASSVIADFRESHRYGNAVRAAHLGGRVDPAGNAANPQARRVRRLSTNWPKPKPDGILVRNLAGLAFCRRKGLPAVADFSLNAANDLSVEWLHAQGARRVTAAYDLNPERLLDLAAAVPPEWLEVVVHRHTPMFHSEYCVFCGMFSSGKQGPIAVAPASGTRFGCAIDWASSILLSDSQCRNTLFHAEAESLLEIMPRLQERGVRHFRVELLMENSVERSAARSRPIGGCAANHNPPTNRLRFRSASSIDMTTISDKSRRAGQLVDPSLRRARRAADGCAADCLDGSWTVMNFIDRMFLLHYSEASMAAVLPAGMVHFAMVCFPLGVASYVNTFVASITGRASRTASGRPFGRVPASDSTASPCFWP